MSWVDEKRALLERCLALPWPTPVPVVQPAPYIPPPAPAREVHPEGTCQDCGATEEDEGSNLAYDEGGYHGLLCNNCRMCRRPGGY